MISLDQYVQDQIAKDPSFADALEEARAELRLGLLIYQLREARGWTQRMLAERAGIPQSAVARYEKAGRTPSVTTLWRLAKALNVSLILGPDLSVETIDRRAEAEPSPESPASGRNGGRLKKSDAAGRKPVDSSTRSTAVGDEAEGS